MTIYGSDLRVIGLRVEGLRDKGVQCSIAEIYRTVYQGKLKKLVEGEGPHKLPTRLTNEEWKEINDAVRDALFIGHHNERILFFRPCHGLCMLLTALHDVRQLLAIDLVRPSEARPMQNLVVRERCLIYRADGSIAGRLIRRGDDIWHAELVAFNGRPTDLGFFSSHEEAVKAVSLGRKYAKKTKK